MPQLGVGIARARLYRPKFARCVDPFEVVSIKDVFTPYFLWCDRNSPQVEIAGCIARRLRRQDKTLRFHGLLTLRSHYLPQWLGGEITWSPLHWRRCRKDYPTKTTDERMADFERVIRTGVRLAAVSESVDVVSQIFDSGGGFRPYGYGLLHNAFRWARESNRYARLFLSEILGNSEGRWLQILESIDGVNDIDGIALQIHRPVYGSIEPTERLLQKVLGKIAERGLTIQLSEVQVWLTRPTPPTDEAFREWSQWHESFYRIAHEYGVEQYVIWNAADPVRRIPFGGHSAGAFDENINPKPFLQNVQTLDLGRYPRVYSQREQPELPEAGDPRSELPTMRRF